MSPRVAFSLVATFAGMILLFSPPVRLLTGHYYRWWADKMDPPPARNPSDREPVDTYMEFLKLCKSENSRLEIEKHNLTTDLQLLAKELTELRKKVPPPVAGPKPRNDGWLLECPWPPSGTSFTRMESSERMIFDQDEWGRWFCKEKSHL